MRADSPPCKRRGGRAIKKWCRSEKARTGWSLASDVSECVLKHLRVSDHPVCGASVASRLFSDAAATPPHEEGNAHGHRPPLQTICWYRFFCYTPLVVASGNVVEAFSPRSAIYLTGCLPRQALRRRSCRHNSETAAVSLSSATAP